MRYVRRIALVSILASLLAASACAPTTRTPEEVERMREAAHRRDVRYCHTNRSAYQRAKASQYPSFHGGYLIGYYEVTCRGITLP